jgi:hypothetical protein
VSEENVQRGNALKRDSQMLARRSRHSVRTNLVQMPVQQGLQAVAICQLQNEIPVEQLR